MPSRCRTDHYGLEKIRIVFLNLAVRRLVKIKGSILCFVGPPGVGKTAGMSIAKATGRA